MDRDDIANFWWPSTLLYTRKNDKEETTSSLWLVSGSSWKYSSTHLNKFLVAVTLKVYNHNEHNDLTRAEFKSCIEVS